MGRPFATDKTLQSAVSASANGNSLPVVGLSAVAFQITGTFVATVTFEGTIDASTWVSVLARNVATGAVASTATAAGVYVATCGGLSLVRARVTWTSGTSVTVIALAQAMAMGDASYAQLLASTAAIGKLAANSGVDIGDVDVTSVVPGTAATNLGKAEDAAHTSGDTGVMALAVRKDTPAATGADGDYEPLQVTGGRLHVTQSDVQLDDTDKLAASLYGKGTDAGDTPVTIVLGSALEVAQRGGAQAYTDGMSNSVHKPISHANGDLIPRGYPFLFNGTTWDRQRSNQEVTLLASAARTAETNSADQINYNGRGLIVYVDWTVETDTVTLTPKLQVKDSIGSGYFTVWTAAAALTAIGDAVYLFYPGIVAAASGSYTEAVNLLVGRTWRFQMGVADTDEATYSVSAVVLV